MENILDNLNIIKPLRSIIYNYLSKSHKRILNLSNNEIDIDNLIKYDAELMIYYINFYYKNRNVTFFNICAKYGKLDNMKWLLKNQFPYNEETFESAAKNGNLDNMKWLFKNKFVYD